jgi:transcriptional regulator
MFIPKFYRNNNQQEIIEFIDKNNFGILISTNESNKIIATHIPFICKQEKGIVFLTAHVSKANEQWKNIASLKEVLVIFQGPHAYISSSWYDHINVPTWDYIAVHVYGISRILDDAETLSHLDELVSKHEFTEKKPVSLDSMTMPYVEKEMRGLIAFEIKVTEMMSAFKLSQNRDVKNLDQIIKELQKRGDENALAIADALCKIKESKSND